MIRRPPRSSLFPYPPLSRSVFAPPAVPLIVTPAPLKPLTGALKTALKLIGEALVGSAWPAAWLIVTLGGLATLTVTGSDVHVVKLSTALATAVRVCEPLLVVVVFQEIV